MIIENENKSDKTFLIILTDGKFHQKVTGDTVGAVKRDIKDKITGEITDTKWELLHDSVKGKITQISIQEGEYGKNLQVTIDGEVISVGVKGSFGEDLLKKLPATDFSKEITLTPYAFIPKGSEKKLKGVTVYQGSIKVESKYYDKETKKSINGCPTPDGDGKGFDSDDWAEYFNKVRKFMVAEVEKLPIFVVENNEEKVEEVSTIENF